VIYLNSFLGYDATQSGKYSPIFTLKKKVAGVRESGKKCINKFQTEVYKPLT